MLPIPIHVFYNITVCRHKQECIYFEKEWKEANLFTPTPIYI